MKTCALRAVAAAAVLAAGLGAGPARAGLVGATYDASVTGATVGIGFAPATYTDPANPGVCIETPLHCNSAQGFFLGFSFSDVSETLSTLTFSFSGFAVDVSDFTIQLSHFLTTDGSRVTDVSGPPASVPPGATGSFGSGSAGAFGLASWDGQTATFHGSPGLNSGYFVPPRGIRSMTFNVTLAPAAVPEPATLALAGVALAGLGLAGRRPGRAAGRTPRVKTRGGRPTSIGAH